MTAGGMILDAGWHWRSRAHGPVLADGPAHAAGRPHLTDLSSERRQAENATGEVKGRGPRPGGPASHPYSASHTVSSWQFRKWLGVIDQPRTLERYGTMRFHWKVMM